MARKSNPATAAKAAGDRDLIATADKVMASERPSIERLRLRKEIIDLRATANVWHVASKFADGMAKFGGGSLLTAALLLFIQRQAGGAALTTAVLTLLLFLGGSILSALFELWAARGGAEADGLQAVLNETGV